MTSAPGHQQVDDLLREAESRLWTEFNSSSIVKHSGDKGEVRVSALRELLDKQLPDRFAVTSGSVIDADGRQTQQQDVLIYDAVDTRPLYDVDGIVVLPAEALLATIEVKSTLTRAEIDKSVHGVASVRDLRPWDASWDVGERGKDSPLPRSLATVFAYSTDLVPGRWPETELRRIRDSCEVNGLPTQYLDRVVVLNRGVVLPAPGQVAQPSDEKGVLGLWFFHLVNFLSREVSRRKRFPWERYHLDSRYTWTKIAPPLKDAGPAARATSTDRLKARKKRNEAAISKKEA